MYPYKMRYNEFATDSTNDTKGILITYLIPSVPVKYNRYNSNSVYVKTDLVSIRRLLILSTGLYLYQCYTVQHSIMNLFVYALRIL